LANQIAAGEVVERPASVAKELVENAIDAAARRITIDIEAGGRRLLRVTDDGEGMTRDDAILAFERHATSKIARAEDLNAIKTLGFRGEALASIASVARVELVTKTDEMSAATRVAIEGGRMRDVKDAAHPSGTTITVRDLFFNVPARRKFLRSEATESFHLTNLVTHYALAHPEITLALTNNGRESLRAAPARDLRERAYQIFGASFIENLLELAGGHGQIARVRGFVSAPRERRTSRDAQYLFVNGRFVRDRLISRALSEGYRSVLPHGVYPVALLFVDVPPEEVDVNVHPAKTEVRFRRAAAIADAVREAVRTALASNGFAPADNSREREIAVTSAPENISFNDESTAPTSLRASEAKENQYEQISAHSRGAVKDGSDDVYRSETASVMPNAARQNVIAFSFNASRDDVSLRNSLAEFDSNNLNEDATPKCVTSTPEGETGDAQKAVLAANDHESASLNYNAVAPFEQDFIVTREGSESNGAAEVPPPSSAITLPLPPLASAAHLLREVPLQSVSTNIRPLGQLEESFIIATDDDGLLLIDQHVAHERILFDKYRALEQERGAESQNLLMPETFDLTPAQAAAFDLVAAELESYGFGLMRLSGRTVAINAVPADLPASEARNLLAEILETIDVEKRGAARANLRDEIAASLACRAAIKINMPLAPEKMRWLIDRLLLTSSPTTCPHGRPVILRLTTRDIERGFHRP
jgi:DNA mismatch repair protein MutL